MGREWVRPIQARDTSQLIERICRMEEKRRRYRSHMTMMKDIMS